VSELPVLPIDLIHTPYGVQTPSAINLKNIFSIPLIFYISQKLPKMFQKLFFFLVFLGSFGVFWTKNKNVFYVFVL